MRTSQKKFGLLEAVRRILILSLIIAPLCVATAQQEKKAASKDSISGKYEGTAKNNAQDIIQVTFELTEKEGTMSGMIRSDHGDFTISGGSHKGEDVTLDFDANGSNGTITLKLAGDKLSGTWSAGEDGGPVEVKRVAAQEAPKEKS
jgi:hypothetical protein